MTIEKIDNVYCIEGFGADSNSYLIGNTLIDTGTGNNPTYLINELKLLDLTIDDIETIVNTHCHYDHVGGNQIFPNAKVAIGEFDAPALKDNSHETACSLFGENIKRRDVDILLKENDNIEGFTVINTPGHSQGGISLWNGEILISGDTVFANGGFGRTDFGGNLEELVKSLEKLSQLDAKYLLPGHGPWTINGKSHVQLAYNLANDL